MFKFELGAHDRCAGCVLAIPDEVWDSWQRHLSAPTLKAEADGTFSFLASGHSRPEHVWARIFTHAICRLTESEGMTRLI
jgi:hypothetical protein